ncbi:lipopolysaccharide biosynthesis protein [Sphingomonas sp. TF3]|uniref:lipopolysaccharide biosynthesis protein n=1 Tax=unclassified Sphingomonas TaxID=196159 RepID=UPI000F893F42|nr:lipopolysaccharide biosynthesis protein [Sphingomonas sp. TF3]
MSALAGVTGGQSTEEIDALAKGGRTNIIGFMMRLVARLPFLFIAGRLYGPDTLGTFARAVLFVEVAALLATFGLKRGLAQAIAEADERPHVQIVWDCLVVAAIASGLASAALMLVPELMYHGSSPTLLERLLPCIIVASAWSDIMLAGLAYRRNVQATVTARAVIEPWTISIAAGVLYPIARHDGLVIAYMLSMIAALAASAVPFVRSYGRPHGWRLHPARTIALIRRNAPLAGADALEWGTRNVDRSILFLMFEPRIVGIYWMAQQVASIPGKLKTSFDPILGPVITTSLARGDNAGVASQVRQVGFWILAAQTGLAMMGSIPGEAVMGTVGPQFVAGTAALAFLLFAEAAASTGAVCESALVYIARLQNMAISIGMLLFQVGLSFALIFGMQWLGWPLEYQAAGPAIALFLSVALTSIIKSNYLAHLLKARVAGWRWPMAWAVLAAGLVGGAFTLLPHRFEWAELLIGEPAIAGVYLFVLYRFAFGPEDRALFRRMPGAEAVAA